VDLVILSFASLLICVWVLYDMNKWSNNIDIDVELDELDRDNIN